MTEFFLSKYFTKVDNELPNLNFRDKDPLIHYASSTVKCKRAMTYKALGIPESNPIDETGQLKMKFGNWIERGLTYDYMTKMSPYNVYFMGTQGRAGDYEIFNGTNWHGMRDFDLLVKDPKTNKFDFYIVELKTKIGFGANFMIKKTPFSKKFKVPEVDNSWGYANQLGLYLRNAYLKTKNNPKFKKPITKGILLYFLFSDSIMGFVEFHAEYLPEKNAIRFFKVLSPQFPEANSKLNTIIKLDTVGEHWAAANEFIKKKELAPPDYNRKYDLDDPRVTEEATKSALEAAARSDVLIGDVQCKYCQFRDKCSKDLNIPLVYSKDEKAKIKKILKTR